MRGVVDNLMAQAAVRPEAPAYIDGEGAISYRDLLRQAERAAAWLWQRGVRPDDVVALTLEAPSPAARAGLYVFYGAAYLGATLLPFYPEAPLKGRRQLGARYGASRHVTASAFGEVAPGEHRTPPPRGDRAERALFYNFSSGTTSEPKALLFAHGQLAANIAAGSRHDRWRADDRVVSGQPWPSKVGLRYLLRLHAAGGAYVSVPFPPRRDRLAYLMRKFGVTGLCGPPWMMRRLLRTTLSVQVTLPPLRALRVSGAASQADELRALRAEITPNVYCSYGCTEVGLVASLRPEDPVSDPVSMRIVTTGLEAQVVDERDAPLAPGAIGRLRYRAPWAARGYVDDAEASAEHFRDGWFYPGDVGAIDAAGWLTLQGRVSDPINHNGVTILPPEIEAVLLAHPEIADAAVIGVPREPSGQLPVAFVVPRAGTIDLDALRLYCHERCGEQRTPARFIATPELPRNAAGKVSRPELAARFRVLVRKQEAELALPLVDNAGSMPELETVWNQRHQSASPWESGKPCAELQRVLQEQGIAPGRALELGCGNGANAVFLASRGFDVTAVDVSGEVLERARGAAQAAKARVRFVHSDVLKLLDLKTEVGAPFQFVFDRGYYQHGRTQRDAFERVLERVTAPGSLYLAIMPNANDAVRIAPRAVRDTELRTDLARLFDVVQLRECRFDPVTVNGRELRPLMWSALFIRK